MTDKPVEPRTSRLGLGALLGAAFRTLAAYHLIFIAAAASPLAFDVIGYTLLRKWNAAFGSNVLLNLAFDGIFLALYAVFLVAMNRAILVGPEAVHRPFHFSLGRREWLTFAYALVLIGVMSTFLLIGLSVLSISLGKNFFSEGFRGVGGAIPASAVFNLACVLVSVRFVFIFPAIACDGEFGWRRSWADTRGLTATLAGAVFVSLMSVTILKFAEAYLETFYGALGAIGPGVISVLFDVCYYYLEAVGILAVALAYRQRVGLPAG